MALAPIFTVRVALASDPLASSPSWTDISTYLLAGSIRTGRQHSLEQFEPGRATLVLDNRDRRFDPWHTSGPYTTTFRPGKRVNIRAALPLSPFTTYDVYTGYVDRIRPVWSQADAQVEVDLVDAFAILNRKDLLRDNYATEVLSDSPAAYYRMGDAAGATVMTDSSGNSRHGTYNGSNGKVSAPGGVYGDRGSSLDCGNKQQSAVGPTTAGFTGASPHAVEMLVYYGAVPPLAGTYTLFDQDIGGGNRFVVSVLDSSRVRIDCTGGPVDSVATLKLFAWNYISAGIDGSNNFRLRVNGASVVTGTYTGGVMTQNPPHIGEDYLGTKNYFGRIDEVATFNGTIPTDADTLSHFGWSSAALNDQLGSARFTSLLDHVGWPAGDRDITTSDHVLAPVVEPLAGQSLLDHFQAVARTEYGLFYVDGAGKIVFRNELPTSAPSSVATFGEGASEIHYVAVDAEYSLEHVANEVSVRAVASAGLADAYATDATSVTAYGPRTLSQDGLLFRDQSGLDARATRLKNDRKDPRKRMRSVGLRAQDDSANTIPVMLATQLGDTVTVKRTPVGGGSTISVVSLVDGISHTIGPATWVTEFALSPW